MRESDDIKNKRLYECFGLKSQEELFEKLTKKDPQVKDLLIFLENQKLNIDNKNKSIDCPEKLINFSKEYVKLQSPGEITIIHCDSKNRIVLDEKVNFKNKVKFLRGFANNIYKNKTNSIFVIRDKKIDSRTKLLFYKKIIEITEYLGIKVLDEAIIDNTDRTKISSFRDFTVSLKINPNEEKTNRYNSYTDFSKTLDYNEFIKKYISKNIIRLNLEKDYEEINTLLKLGYQNLNVEVMGALTVDEEKNILEIKDLSLGTVNQSLVNPSGFVNLLYENIKSDGILIFHNHPSGSSQPSREDLLITERLYKIFNSLDYKFYDHNIIAKEKVYSIAKENSLNFSFDKLNVVKETKKEQEIKR